MRRWRPRLLTQAALDDADPRQAGKRDIFKVWTCNARWQYCNGMIIMLEVCKDTTYVIGRVKRMLNRVCKRCHLPGKQQADEQ
jgi:hypothetical protein